MKPLPVFLLHRQIRTPADLWRRHSGDNHLPAFSGGYPVGKPTPVLLLLIWAYLLAAASAARADAGWTEYARVIELVPTTRHYYEVQLAVKRNQSGCRDDNWFYLNYDLPGSDKMFDLFLESVKNSLRLRVYVTGVCNLKGYSEISAVGAIPN